MKTNGFRDDQARAAPSPAKGREIHCNSLQQLKFLWKATPNTPLNRLV
ncbi:hypothetical protein Rahaq2_0598 [Rahnella aquatilis CIP 78.65 = ATCC 33071]|uniref:Uncharacterized protein n=1 Tax=Rahnella aquatilis (strain ATCC 33071 / DSM 4594 / JCM 1683 / NBRC 105701 / NCIMB 13365 / CIP 78.65) TaxID=745277 RepID=H2ITS3_RAHAC|nr:hypothetical protein Rahaq2_0598 [Rahnella aquatilis CIP 78.65 = ATCC 33071]